jgi:hypothetical protein
MISQKHRGNLPRVSKMAVKKLSRSTASDITWSLEDGRLHLHRLDYPGRTKHLSRYDGNTPIDTQTDASNNEILQTVRVPTPRPVSDDSGRSRNRLRWIKILTSDPSPTTASIHQEEDLDEVQEKEDTASRTQPSSAPNHIFPILSATLPR